MTEHIKEFLAVAEKVKSLGQRISAARYIPEARAQRVSNIKLVSGSGFHEPKREDLDLAARVRSAIALEAAAAGKAEKNAALLDIAREIESFRVLLPQMAASACVELGALMRDLRMEAGDGQQ